MFNHCMLTQKAFTIPNRTYLLSSSMGTEGNGHMFPGVTRPFGVVKLGPDVETGADSYSGYASGGKIVGFSMMHMSGTGGAPKYGVVSQYPVIDELLNPLRDLSAPRARPDEAQVGYYKTSLSSGVTVELAATEHSAMYQYSVSDGRAVNVVIDVSHVLQSFRGQGLSQGYRGGNISISEDGHYEGFGTYSNGWNRAPDYTVFFCGHFTARASQTRTFYGQDETLTEFGESNTVGGDGRLGAVYSFEDQDFTSRVGISWISTAKACAFVEAEIPSEATFESIVEETKASWNEQVLSKITTTETNVEKLRLLYSSLYGMHLIPSNRTGENPLWESSEPYYDDIVTFWDLHRCTTPLWHILQPDAYEEQIRSLIDIWRNVGFLPDGRSSNFNGKTQGGSNADNVLADAYVKGVRGAVDWNDGYKAMLKNAEVVPENTNDPMSPESSTKEGRGALVDWLEYGYITPDFTRAVSRAVEYAANDFALSQVAKGLQLPDDEAKYLDRSRNWQKHWNRQAESLGFTGFVTPRLADGSFVDQDPLSCGGCYWGDAYYQALPWEYSFNALHDMESLITLAGGPNTFERRLDTMFQPNSNPRGDVLFNKTIFNPGNEPDFASPYLFNFVGRQDLSVARSRSVATEYYTTAPDGLPGNSDGGAMQSWLLWNMIGLYPLTGQTTFLIASPWFASMTIALGGDKTLTVTSEGGSDAAIYVQSLKVNGEEWDKAWLAWDDVFADGGTLEFVLGVQPAEWATGDLPPSPASGERS
ncbi:MAG: hypothetical protein M1833_004748 [Piccolia ochrophora]|nr:MAG: hypothetical protein M1833_004748 [Piccolia ochrophora]